MEVAIISDIHGNLTALEAVEDKLDDLGVEYALCAGDIVGYGPRPRQCVDKVHQMVGGTVSGNHDRKVINGGSYHSRGARRGIEHAISELENPQFQLLESSPRTVIDETLGVSWQLTHSSPHITDSVEHVYEDEISSVFGPYIETDVLFYGHTHVPVNTVVEDCLVVNPGSVGQPRDGNPKASFAVIDFESVSAEIHRVQYNIDKTAREIRAADLPEDTAKRLYTAE
jgi:putative phosphoesterase